MTDIPGAAEIIETWERKSRTVTPGGPQSSSNPPISQPPANSTNNASGNAANLAMNNANANAQAQMANLMGLGGLAQMVQPVMMGGQVLTPAMFPQGQVLYPQLLQGMGQPGVMAGPVVMPNMNLSLLNNMNFQCLQGFQMPGQNPGGFFQGGIISPINANDMAMRMNQHQH